MYALTILTFTHLGYYKFKQQKNPTMFQSFTDKMNNEGNLLRYEYLPVHW